MRAAAATAAAAVAAGRQFFMHACTHSLVNGLCVGAAVAVTLLTAISTQVGDSLLVFL